MQYVMKAGVLYDRNQKKVFARVKREIAGTERKILSPEGVPVLHTDILRSACEGLREKNPAECGEDPKAFAQGDVRQEEYVLENETGRRYAAAWPYYADGEEPEKAGWPAYRMPKVDHAHLRMDGHEFEMVMKNGTHYTVSDASGEEALHISHRGLAGGWDIVAEDKLPAATVCGLFLFCRYMEQENELAVV